MQAHSRRTAFVTGASYGVGAATALALAHEGYDIAVSATRAENLKPILAQLELTKSRAVPIVLDLRSEPSIERAMAKVLAELGELDLLVNNAAATLRKLAVDVSWAEWDAVFTPNVTGTFFLTQRVGRHLISTGRPGCVVNIVSTHGLVGAPSQSTYGISKAAVIHMTKMLAIEWDSIEFASMPLRRAGWIRRRRRAPSAPTIKPTCKPCCSAFRCTALRPSKKWLPLWSIWPALGRHRSQVTRWCSTAR